MTSSAKSNVDNDDLICPITYQIFRDPVIAGDGHTYERAAIVRWIAEHGTSPLTRQPLNINELQADDYLKNLAAQRQSSSTSSNYSINLDQSVLEQQNSTMPYNCNVYIDRPLFSKHQTIIFNNDVASVNNFHVHRSYFILTVIMLALMIIFLLSIPFWLLYFGPLHHKYSGETISSIPTNTNTKSKRNGVTVAGGNGHGDQLNQLSLPSNIYVDDDNQCIYIADFGNNRIVKWKFGAKNGQVVAGGNQMDQLTWSIDVIVDKKTDSLIICNPGNRRVVQWPRQNGTKGQTIISDIGCDSLTMDNNENLYVSDYEKKEVRRWKLGDKKGTIVAGGNGKGHNLNQLNYPANIFVDEDHSVYVSDNSNHRVMKWMKGAKEGIVVAGGNGEGNSLKQLSDPRGVIADHLGNVYVADNSNHRVMRWAKGSKEGSIIVGGNGYGQQPNQLNNPQDLSFDRQGNLYVVDMGNNRIQKFDIISN